MKRYNWMAALIACCTLALGPALAQEEVKAPVLSPVLGEMIDEAAAADLSANADSPASFRRLIQTVDLALRAFPDEAELIEEKALNLLPGDNAQAAAAAVRISTLAAEAVAAREAARAALPPEPEPRRYAWLDPRGWNGQFDLGGNFTTGNTEEQGLNLALLLKRIFSDYYEHRFQADFNYAQSFGVRTQQRLSASHQFFYRGWDRAFFFTFVSYEDDEFDGFNYRAVQNIGAGYTVLRGDRFNWDIEAGPGVRQTETDGGDFDLEILGRASSRLEWLIRDDVTFSDTTTALFGSETTAENTATLNIKLLNALSLNLSFYVQFDTNTPEDAESIDTISKATISYTF